MGFRSFEMEMVEIIGVIEMAEIIEIIKNRRQTTEGRRRHRETHVATDITTTCSRVIVNC